MTVRNDPAPARELPAPFSGLRVRRRAAGFVVAVVALPLLTAVLDVLAARYRSWTVAEGDPDASGVRQAYVVRCATIGRTVRVELADGALEGQAVGVDPDGCLRVNDLAAGTEHRIAAGDVVHVR